MDPAILVQPDGKSLSDASKQMLQLFNEKFSGGQALDPASLCNDVSALAQNLVSLCVTCAETDHIGIILQSVRHCLRNPKAREVVVGGHESIFPCVSKNFGACTIACCKLLVNMLLAAPKEEKGQLFSALIKLRFGSTVSSVLAGLSFENVERAWVLSRLCVHLTSNAGIKEQFGSSEPLVRLVEHFEPLASKTKEDRPLQSLSDALRVLFNFTMEYGPLSSAAARAAKDYPLTATGAEQDNFPADVEMIFNRVSPVLNRILAWDYVAGSQGVRDVYISGVALAINMSKRFLLKFDAQVALPNLIGVLSFCIDQPGKPNESAIAPLLMLLTKVSKEIPETRAVFFLHIFPRWKEILGEESETDGVVVPAEHEGTVGGKIITKLMTNSAVTLQFYSAEFILVLCGSNAGAFTRMCGFGTAAGHLAVRGLMNMGGGDGGASAATAESSDAEETPKTSSANTTTTATVFDEAPPRGVPGPIRPPPQPSNMSEQDLLEWNELMDKIERLNKLGVIKMMGPEDGGPK